MTKDTTFSFNGDPNNIQPSINISKCVRCSAIMTSAAPHVCYDITPDKLAPYVETSDIDSDNPPQTTCTNLGESTPLIRNTL